MQTIETAQTIGEILQNSPMVNISVKCEKCGCRPKHREAGIVKKWCKRCIDIYNRMKSIESEQLEKQIIEIVEPLYIDAKLSDFDEKIQNKILALNDRDLFITGKVGTGKTHLMAALIRHYAYIGYNCGRINFDDFCVQIRSTMGSASKMTEWDYIEPMKILDLLCIDDLGLRSKIETDFAYVTLYSILNKRQERMLPTFISTNKTIKQLGQTFDARIESRLSLAVQIELVGVDRRKKGI